MLSFGDGCFVCACKTEIAINMYNIFMLQRYLAVIRYREEMVNKLLEDGADVNSSSELFLDGSFGILLNFAVMRSRADVVERLVQNGTNVNAVDNFNHTPLHLAVMTSGAHVVELLVQNGANVNAVDNFKCTPLFLAVRKYRADVVELLVQNGANVNAVDMFGNNVLYAAVENPNTPYEIIKLLLEIGAKPDFDEVRNILININQPNRYHIAELLIKYIVLRIAANSGTDLKLFLNQFKTVLFAHFAKNSDRYKYFLSVGHWCFNEAIDMKHEFINNKQTLFQFVSEKCVKTTAHDEKVSLNDIYSLQFLRKNRKYSEYRSLVYSTIKRSVLVERLCELEICCKAADSDTVTLTYYSIDHLAKYISNEDVIHMIIASCDEINDPKCSSTYISKRVEGNVCKKLRK